MNLELITLIPECSGSLCIVQVHISLSMHLLDYIKYTQTIRLVSKGQVVAHLPANGLVRSGDHVYNLSTTRMDLNA
jgi:hypothetical protein